LEVAKEKIDRISELPIALGAWTNFFYYSHLISEGKMTVLLQDQPAVQQAYGKYQQFNRDERLRALDEAHQRFLHDHATDMEEAHDKGWNKRNIEIAQNMKRKGYATDDIAEMTGLSSSEVERLG
jgi:predicted transposase/invertase (TIGR01784 family)